MVLPDGRRPSQHESFLAWQAQAREPTELTEYVATKLAVSRQVTLGELVRILP